MVFITALDTLTKTPTKTPVVLSTLHWMDAFGREALCKLFQTDAPDSTLAW